MPEECALSLPRLKLPMSLLGSKCLCWDHFVWRRDGGFPGPLGCSLPPFCRKTDAQTNWAREGGQGDRDVMEGLPGADGMVLENRAGHSGLRNREAEVSPAVITMGCSYHDNHLSTCCGLKEKCSL